MFNNVNKYKYIISIIKSFRNHKFVDFVIGNIVSYHCNHTSVVTVPNFNNIALKKFGLICAAETSEQELPTLPTQSDFYYIFKLLFTNPLIVTLMPSAILQHNHLSGNCIYPLHSHSLTLLLLYTTCLVLTNSVDPDQLASEEANWFGSALFAIKYVIFYQSPRSSNLTCWKLEVGVAS